VVRDLWAASRGWKSVLMPSIGGWGASLTKGSCESSGRGSPAASTACSLPSASSPDNSASARLSGEEEKGMVSGTLLQM